MIEFQTVDIDTLVPYAKNARVHNEAHIAQLAGSIREFGFNIPVLIDEKSNVIAGHGRLLAARKLGMTEVPVLIADHLTDLQRRAFIIADNKLHDNSSFDYELLSLEVEELKEEGFDTGIIGFEQFEVDSLSHSTMMSDLEDNVFSQHIGRESEEFSITFVFPKGKESEFDRYLQEHSKAELTERIIEMVVGE